MREGPKLRSRGERTRNGRREERAPREERRPPGRVVAGAVDVAVVVSGSLRTFLECNASFFERVAKPNPGFAFDFYVYAVVHDVDRAEREALERLKARHPRVRGLEVVSSSDAAEFIKKDMPKLAALPPGEGTARGKASNVASMFRSIDRADALRRDDDERTHALVIRARPDLRWCSDVNLTAALALSGDDVVLARAGVFVRFG